MGKKCIFILELEVRNRKENMIRSQKDGTELRSERRS